MRYKVVNGQVTTIDDGGRLQPPEAQLLQELLPPEGTNGEIKPAQIHALILKDLQDGPREAPEGEGDRLLESYKHALWSLYYTRLALYERDGV